MQKTNVSLARIVIRPLASLLVAVTLAFGATAVRAQEPALSASGARLHVAGPDVLLLDGVEIDGAPYLVYVAADADGNWSITNLEPVGDRAIPRDVVLDLARLEVTPSGALRST